jgi:ribonuclease HI
MKIEIYTDGSSSPKRGGTGWAWVLTVDGQVRYADYGGSREGTNNTAELTAAIEGLLALEKVFQDLVSVGDTVTLVSDSRYVLGMATGRHSPIKNLELIERLKGLYSRLCTDTRWVRGHSGDPFNERCDRLAKKGRDSVGVGRG